MSTPPPTVVEERVRQRMEEVRAEFMEEMGDSLPSTAEEILAVHLEAIGGREAFDTIQSAVLRFKATGTAGALGELIRYHKRPFHYRQEMYGSGRSGVTDGERFWWVTSEGWERADEEVSGYLPFVSLDNLALDPGAVGVSHEFLGVSVLDMDPGYEVLRVFPDGSQEVLFFSALSGLLTARRTPYALTTESWYSLWDYRELGGVLLPFVHIRSIGDLGPPHGLVLQSVEINVPLPDSLFLPPGER
jgi:hypothetical protein